MKRALLLVGVILSCVALGLVGLSPAIVTYAELPPVGISCNSCSTPDVSLALAKAAAAGRAQIQSLAMSNGWLLVVLGAVNALCAVGLFWPSRK
jgi:hypothetical protein